MHFRPRCLTQLHPTTTRTRTLAKMDANNKSGSGSSEAAPSQADPKQVLNSPHLLAGTQALHKAYNKYNIKPTKPSPDIPRVDHSKGQESKEANKDDETKA